MSEYWKSLPRKFCDICKCWFADNKASIQFHERGKRHQENAAKRIKDIQKRGIKDFKKQQKLEDDMSRIERAALAAYKKDLQNNSEAVTSTILPPEQLQPANFIEVPIKKERPVSFPKKKKEKPKIKQEPVEDTNHSTETCISEETPVKVWYEAMTDEGYKYYWNNLDSESQWEPPVGGFVSIEEQAEESTETTIEVAIKVEKGEEAVDKIEDTVTIKKEEEDEEDKEVPISPPHNMGPQPKYDPYGQWVTVKKVEPVQIDLQLPKPSEDYVEVVIPVARDEPRLKFKEKVISYIGEDDSTDVTFKKRKFTGSSKRNTRQRTNDDD